MPLNKPNVAARRSAETICRELAGQFAALAEALQAAQRSPAESPTRRAKPVTPDAAYRMLRRAGLTMTRSTLYRWIQSGTLPAVRVGGKTWVLPARLNEIIAEVHET
jgi:hypothetical protein